MVGGFIHRKKDLETNFTFQKKTNNIKTETSIDETTTQGVRNLSDKKQKKLECKEDEKDTRQGNNFHEKKTKSYFGVLLDTEKSNQPENVRDFIKNLVYSVLWEKELANQVNVDPFQEMVFFEPKVDMVWSVALTNCSFEEFNLLSKFLDLINLLSLDKTNKTNFEKAFSMVKQPSEGWLTELTTKYLSTDFLNYIRINRKYYDEKMCQTAEKMLKTHSDNFKEIVTLNEKRLFEFLQSGPILKRSMFGDVEYSFPEKRIEIEILEGDTFVEEIFRALELIKLPFGLGLKNLEIIFSKNYICLLKFNNLIFT